MTYHRLWSSPRAERRVALSETEELPLSRLIDEALAWGARLAATATPGEGQHPEALGIDPQGRRETLVTLVAAWLAGRAVRWAPGAACLSRAGRELGSLQEAASRRAAAVDTQLRADTLLAVLSTSGTTGIPEVEPKTAGQLLGEIDALEATLGWGESDVVLATVPAQHLYGLLFSVLLPLRVGAPLVTSPRVEPGEFHPLVLAEVAARFGATRLVTVPAHLRALLAAEVDLGPVREIVTSAARLDPSVAREAEARFGVPVIDVLGSTETGGIALRRAAQSERWRPLPGVRVKADERSRLWIESPFAAGAGRALETGDRGEVALDGTFVHLGRHDGVVKIGGKRFSLQELERVARELPGVSDAVALRREVPGLRGEELWLALETSETDVAAFRRELAARLDPVFVPRKLRLVPRLPRSERGKVPREELAALFTPDLTLTLAADSPRFVGHFPNAPLLPAVALLVDTILPAARARFGVSTLKGLERLRFLRPLCPGARIELRLEKTPSGVVRFEVQEAGALAASGSLRFE